MKLTKAQQNELVVWKYFMPKDKWMAENEEDIKKFFEWSERGKHKDEMYGGMSYFNALRQGKRWAGIHMHEMYEQGVLDGSMPYYVILGGVDNDPIPREVVNFIKKEMFKGGDSDIIEDCYNKILNENS
jgi:hypothetical protein